MCTISREVEIKETLSSFTGFATTIRNKVTAILK